MSNNPVFSPALELVGEGSGAPTPAGANDTGHQLGRTPPQDNGAEQSVLGAMLLSKDAIADVVEQVKGGDFYRPAHETIFDVVLDLYGRGEPADAVTVVGELTRRGELTRVGGAPYLHTLVSQVPIAANAAFYAHIVREKAILRRLIEAGTKIAQMGYAETGQIDDVVDAAQSEVFAVTEARTSEDYAPLTEIMEATFDELEAIGARAQTFSLEPGLPNSIGPRKRPRTTLSPSVALRDGEPYLSFGTPGGDMQDQWPLIFLLNHLHFGMNLQEAIDSPTWNSLHFPSSFMSRISSPKVVRMESRVPVPARRELERRGHVLDLSEDWSLGMTSAVSRDRDAMVRAGVSPRGLLGYASGR